MSLQRTSTRIGVFALLLGVIVLSLFGSLVAADRALENADRRALELDSRGAVHALERDIIAAFEHVNGSRPVWPFTTALPLLSSATHEERVDSLYRYSSRRGADLDSIARRSGLTPQREPPMIDPAEDSVRSAQVLAAMRRASDEALRLRSPIVRALPAESTYSRVGGIIIAAPAGRTGRAVGAAFVPATAILESIRDDSLRRPRMALRHNDVTLGAVGDSAPRYGLLVADVPLQLPGDALVLRVAHAQSGRTVRTVLWMLGAIGLATLLVGLARERRQALSLAARTAELERLYQEVARSNRMKSEFLANVSHELRTPLNAIVGFVEMLREGVYGQLAPRQALPVERIAASATHLRQLVDRLLDIAKIAAGRIDIHEELLVLRPFVLNVASEMESLISERGLALSVGVSSSLPRIRTDQTQLRQILINMIGNAVKYTPSGNIQVRARLVGHDLPPVQPEPGEQEGGPPPDPSRRWVAIQVSDTGIGIATPDLERIFDEFEQVNAGARTDSVSRGTGLGLAISRRLARLLGGDLTVISEPGKGSTFTLWLPIEKKESADG